MTLTLDIGSKVYTVSNRQVCINKVQ